MCGIAGIFRTQQGDLEALRSEIGNMNRSQAHRGPDDQGVWISSDGKLGLGHTRLSILDLSPAGHQPMVSDSGTAIVFNGEIYNFRELKKLVPEYPFRSDSDTELILALYEKLGEKCIEHLNGMFSFAIWNPRTKQVFAARDRIGKKPFYYYYDENRLVFASEVRALLEVPGITGELDHRALYDFLTFGFCPPPRTMFRNIMKLEPGTCITIDQDLRTNTRCYWEPVCLDLPEDEDEIVQRMQEQLLRSIDWRLVSDVPVGVFLSGGVDSTGLLALAKERGHQGLRSFSISFAGQPAYDEAGIARKSAKRFGLEHYEKTVTSKDMIEMMNVVAGVFDEPMSDPTCIPIYFLSQMARESGTKVVLTGDGPDELLLGYRNWQKYLGIYPWFRNLQKLPGFFKKGLELVSKLANSPKTTEIFHRARQNHELFWGNAPSFRESEKLGFFTDDFARESSSWDSHDAIRNLRQEYDRIYDEKALDGNWMSYVGLRFVIPNFYMHRADRLGMHHSIEIRNPYLDYHFVDTCLSLKASWKVKKRVGKYIFKKVFENQLDHEILYARKRGFCVPLREWGQEIMEGFLEDQLPVFCRETSIFDESRIRKEIKSGNTTNLWNLFSLVAWHSRWVA